MVHDEAEGMVGTTLEGMHCHMLLSVEITLNTNVLVHFYINTLSHLYSLRLQGGGGATATLAPPNLPLHIKASFLVTSFSA